MNFSLDYTSLNKRRINSICDKVNELESEVSSYSDAKLSFMTNTFRNELRNGKTIDDIMPYALAVCREVIKRKLGLRPYDTQIIAASSMSDNIIAEMKTGEGKTLVQILSSYLHVLLATKDVDKSKWGSVHILTANEYLAQRDKEQNEIVFNALGLSCGYAEDKALHDTPNYRSRKVKAYKSDIVYATAKTVAFDYLDDYQVKSKNDRYINRKLYHAIIDEADDILFDQATTPLILSGSMPGINMQEGITLAKWACDFVNGANGVRNKPITCRVCDQYDKFKHTLYKEDCILYKDRMVVDLGEQIYRELYKNDNLNDPNVQLELFNKEKAIMNAILAKFYFQRDKEYTLVEIGSDKGKKVYEVSLVSDTSGRVMKKTKYRNGFQEAIEAEEAYLSGGRYFVKFESSKLERNRITYPEFAHLYETGICGMTGTSDIDEFNEIYNLETYKVPTLKEEKRSDEETEIYATKDSKYRAIANEVLRRHKSLQPILVGTTSVKESNELCRYLDEKGIKYQRLDAKNDKEEALKISRAGQKGMITVATSMAGRGTDIIVDKEVESLGGLFVIGTSKNRSSRVDRQLIGRCARHGQPGGSKFYQSLEDELILLRYKNDKLFAIKKYYSMTGGKIENKAIKKLVDNCQKTEEGYAKQTRRVENKINNVYKIHREKFFEQRNKILEATPRELISIIGDVIKSYAIKVCNSNDEVNDMIKTLLNEFKSSKGSIDPMIYLEYVRSRVLDVLDSYWITHLMKMDELRSSLLNIGFIGQDPIEKFEREANKMFISMDEFVQNEIIAYVTKPNMAFGTYEVEEERHEIHY